MFAVSGREKAADETGERVCFIFNDDAAVDALSSGPFGASFTRKAPRTWRRFGST